MIARLILKSFFFGSIIFFFFMAELLFVTVSVPLLEGRSCRSVLFINMCFEFDKLKHLFWPCHHRLSFRCIATKSSNRKVAKNNSYFVVLGNLKLSKEKKLLASFRIGSL